MCCVLNVGRGPEAWEKARGQAGPQGHGRKNGTSSCLSRTRVRRCLGLWMPVGTTSQASRPSPAQARASGVSGWNPRVSMTRSCMPPLHTGLLHTWSTWLGPGHLLLLPLRPLRSDTGMGSGSPSSPQGRFPLFHLVLNGGESTPTTLPGSEGQAQPLESILSLGWTEDCSPERASVWCGATEQTGHRASPNSGVLTPRYTSLHGWVGPAHCPLLQGNRVTESQRHGLDLQFFK